MIQLSYILKRLQELPHHDQIEALLVAIDFMKEDPSRSREDCIGLALNIPIFPKVETARLAGAYEVAIRFNYNEERVVDFRHFLDPARELEKQLLEDEALFRRFEVEDGALVSPDIGREGQDFEGRLQFFAFDIDPALLFEHSVLAQSV